MRRLRYRKLIQPRLQLRLVGSFLGLSLLALVFQFLLFARAGSELVVAAGEGMTSILLRTLFVSLAVVLPLTGLVGVAITNKIAGPIYRFTLFLNEVKRGQRPADCRIRKDDYLRDFCQLLNEVTEPARRREADGVAADAEPADEATGAPEEVEAREVA